MSSRIASLSAHQFQPERQRWSVRDTQLYALGLNIGQDPCEPLQLRYLESGDPLVLPTQAAVLAASSDWMRDPANGIDGTQLVALSHRISLLRPLPARGEVESQLQVTGVYDRGPGRGAIIHWRRELRSIDGQPLAAVEGRALARGDGGFGGPAPERHTVPAPVGEHTKSVMWATHPGQALLYALSGDRNPLHTDPDAARAAGFERSILHGLCSLGISAFVVAQAMNTTSPGWRLGGISGRYAGVAYPGESLRIDLWASGGSQIRFRCTAAGRESAVIEDGIAWAMREPFPV